MGRRKATGTPPNKEFWDSAKWQDAGFRQYYNRLMELSIAMFDWQNVPDTMDTRFLELTLLTAGHAVFFYDEDLGYLALRGAVGGTLNVYGIPIDRHIEASNGYYAERTMDNSVIIYNNMLHTPSMLDIEIYSRRLADLDRAIDVNAKAQKTPVLIQCEETQRLTMKNLYAQYEGNAPVIFGDKNLNPNAIKVLKTDAPYVASNLYELRTQIWNEALTFLGISNTSYQKKERLITDEVTRSQGGTIASRYSRLNARQQACDEINRMFGLDIGCEFREDYNEELINDMDGQSEQSEESEVGENE